jgi:hypothetical protein
VLKVTKQQIFLIKRDWILSFDLFFPILKNNEHTRYVLKDFRGQAIGSITAIFQWRIVSKWGLRPILKLQMIYFLLYSAITSQKSKVDFLQLYDRKKLAFIENAIQKDSKFRSAFKRMVLALFTMSIWNI